MKTITIGDQPVVLGATAGGFNRPGFTKQLVQTRTRGHVEDLVTEFSAPWTTEPAHGRLHQAQVPDTGRDRTGSKATEEWQGGEEAEMGEPVVVVGVDGSPASYTALRWALGYAGGGGARIRAVRCWTPVLARGWEAAVTGEPVPPEAEQQARAERELGQVVAAALARIPPGATRVGVQQRVFRGPPGPGLVSHAAGVHLLVIGHGGHRSMLHRSVSWYCVRHATCPVLVIPPAMATRRTLAPATAAVPA